MGGAVKAGQGTGDLDWGNMTLHGVDGKRLATGEITPPKPPEKK